MYENTSQGTPISPVFDNAEDLAQWLADNGATSFGSSTATYDQWLSTIKRGFAPSIIITEKRANMKYEYKKVTGYEQKKFIENGHTMFEKDVLQRLKRLVDLEEQLEKANVVKSDSKVLHIDSVVCSAFSDEIATKMLAHCPYEKSGWCKTEMKCRFKLECGLKKGNGCELAL